MVFCVDASKILRNQDWVRVYRAIYRRSSKKEGERQQRLLDHSTELLSDLLLLGGNA